MEEDLFFQLDATEFTREHEAAGGVMLQRNGFPAASRLTALQLFPEILKTVSLRDKRASLPEGCQSADRTAASLLYRKWKGGGTYISFLLLEIPTTQHKASKHIRHSQQSYKRRGDSQEQTLLFSYYQKYLLLKMRLYTPLLLPTITRVCCFNFVSSSTNLDNLGRKPHRMLF